MNSMGCHSDSPPPHALPSPALRRAALIRDMAERAARGLHCAACSGVCCTFVANSMRITPVEARDLREFLEKENRWTPELQERLRDCVRTFRLDQELGDGRRSLRRRYTCPFYQPGPKGCTISRHYKPYGCLAFNPRAPGLTEGGDCASDQNLLEGRENTAESAENARLRDAWAWHTDTLPLPLALLRM